MNDSASPSGPAGGPPVEATPVAEPPERLEGASRPDARPTAGPPKALRWSFVAMALLSLGGLFLAWNTQQRLKSVEGEMVKRQQDAGNQAAEARLVSRQAEATARDTAAKVALLEARVAESSLQRSQLEELIQSLSRSRDENVLSDVDAAIRLALQQSSITGSAEPLLAALGQAQERLARYPQPRMDRVRRAVVQDLDRVRAAGAVDVQSLAIRIDEAVRLVDDLPLLAAIDRRGVRRDGEARMAPGKASAPGAAAPAPAPAASAPGLQWVDARLRWALSQAWAEVRDLIRVTRVDEPEAALLAPEQAFFLRENLKLRLLNARLALLSRQFDTAQADLREAQAALERYFDKGSRRVELAREQLRQVGQQARQVVVPRPDATLAALATAVAGR